MTWFKPKYWAEFGLFIVLLAFLYDLFFAGIPYQDVAPEIEAGWQTNKAIASAIYKIGFAIFMIGLATALYKRICKQRKD